MSFLNELCSKRAKLKPTPTIITRVDGRKFCEFSSETTTLPSSNYGFVVDTKPDEIPARIIDNLYLGAQDCCHLSVLTEHCIGNVLSVGIEAPLKYPGIDYKYVECLDLEESNLEEVLNESVVYIQSALQAKKSVLVHCNAGVSRSASIVIGYLMLIYNYSYPDAYARVKQARNCIRPNDGFVRQLKRLGR